MAYEKSSKPDTFDTFEKRDRLGTTDLVGEAAALRWLAQAEADGGLRVARVVSAGSELLVEERIHQGAPTAEAARRAGRALAHTHAAGAPWWGAPPSGDLGGILWSGNGYVCGGVTIPVVRDRAQAHASWGEFYAGWRMMPLVRSLRDDGTFSREDAALLSRVADRVASGVFDADEPALVQARVDAGKCACARLHGDLWAGNLLWDGSADASTGAALIDPMAHGGHVETDLAMLQLFGCAHLRELLAAYDEESPLADGWRERVGLHQLAPLLLHCALFGGAYVGETLAVARRYA